jgi:hypothetical protein
VLAMEEMKKPLHLRNVVNWGSTVITNKAHIERMIQLDKAKKDAGKLNADIEKQIMNDISKVKAIEKS